MLDFKELFKSDIERYEGNIPQWNKKFSFLFRKNQTCKLFFLRKIYRKMYYKFIKKNGIEIEHNAKIGMGLYIGHPYNITVNPFAVIGDNCSLHKGVTIGQENRGIRKESPTLGNKVWIGVNATVVGKINIGDDVMICPNSFVNCNIPDHSIVLGNPCKIIHKSNATDSYITTK